ncbi:MAG: hypothetical protein K9G62_03290 [Alphaproteobacteria bacterium]|nr:hypothetical protein [Alphaproteobacteria bacterium]
MMVISQHKFAFIEKPWYFILIILKKGVCGMNAGRLSRIFSFLTQPLITHLEQALSVFVPKEVCYEAEREYKSLTRDRKLIKTEMVKAFEKLIKDQHGNIEHSTIEGVVETFIQKKVDELSQKIGKSIRSYSVKSTLLNDSLPSYDFEEEGFLKFWMDGAYMLAGHAVDLKKLKELREKEQREPFRLRFPN